MNRRTLALTLAALTAVVLGAACTAAGVPAPTGAPSAPAVEKPAVTDSPSVDTVGDIAELLILRMAAPTPNAAYTVVEPASHRILFDLADGVVSHDWRTLVSLSADGGSTRVQVTAPESGDLPVRIPVPGSWRLPTIGIARQAGGLSADGGTLVLEEAVEAGPASAASRTRFAIVATGGRTAARIVTLTGSFTYDALSPDGQWLYLLEHLAGADPTHYQVRRLDVASGRLQDGTIVDKRNIDEQMNGYAITQEVGRGGWVYTLYRGADGAFIHALDTADGVAFCIDLPGTGQVDAATDGAWGLVADPTGARLYVTDPTRRAVSAIDLTDFTVARSAKLAAGSGIELAKLESAGAAGGRVALSADGATLYVTDSTGVAVVRVADLVTTGHLGANAVLRSVAVGSSGAVYAVDDAGQAVRLGPNGSTPIANGRYSAIVAIAPLH